jgi:hypothetical protein
MHGRVAALGRLCYTGGKQHCHCRWCFPLGLMCAIACICVCCVDMLSRFPVVQHSDVCCSGCRLQAACLDCYQWVWMLYVDTYASRRCVLRLLSTASGYLSLLPT